MKSETFFYIVVTAGIFGLFATLLYFETNESPTKTIDLNVLDERFDRLEAGITNSAIDVCFSNGGTWLNKEDKLLWIELFEGIEVSLCARPKAANLT